VTSSMRTPGAEVVRGGWGRSLVGGSRSEPFSAARAAVLVCCTAFGNQTATRRVFMMANGWQAGHGAAPL